MDDRDAPPPYSETDIYSNPGNIPQPPLSGSPHPAAAEAGSTTSTSGEPIYTPPLTPQTTYHGNHSNFGGPVSEPPSATIPTNPDAIVSDAAQHYFQSRPPPSAVVPLSHSPIDHVLTIKPNSQPADFPYPGGDFAARDVGIQDWLTFRNFLFPAHSALTTGAVLDRKLREEEESLARQTRGDAADSTSAPPDPINSPSLDQARHQARETERLAEQRSGRSQQEATIAEWNTGFFLPRGIVLKIANVPSSPMPGAFEPACDPFSQANVEPEGPEHSGEQSRPQPNSYQRYNPFALPGGGIRVGGITIDSNGVRFGNSVVADNSGVRMGRLNIDTNGIRYGDNTLLPGRPGARGRHGRHVHNVLGSGHSPEGQHSAGLFGSQPPGFSFPPGPGMPPQPPQPPGPPGVPGMPGMTRGNSDPNPVRGRSPNARGSQSRNSSTSSSSSSSSSRSSASESSIGSLPSPGDLAPPQLPVMQSRLQEWLALAQHPSAPPLTRENVAILRSDITNAASRNPNFREAASASALRREIKVLVAEFKALKKRQRKEKKKGRKDRKMRRKMERRERKQQRKEMRQARREARRNNSGPSYESAARDAPAHEGPGPGGFHIPPTFPMRMPGGGNVEVPTLPTILGQRAAAGRGWGGPWSWGRGRGGPWDGHPGSTPGPWGHWTPGNWGEQWGRGRGGPECLRRSGRGSSRDENEGGRGRGLGRGSSRSRDASAPPGPTESGPGLFSGLFPGAWPGENPPEVPMQLVPQPQNQPQRVFHRVSEAKYAAAERLEEVIHGKEAQLAVLQESIEGIERELETGTVSLVSELEEHERTISRAEIEAASVAAIKQSMVEELEKQLSGVKALASQSSNNSSGSGSCSKDKDKDNECKAKSKEELKALKERLKEEIQMLKEEARKAKENAKEKKYAAQEQKRGVEEKMRSLRREGTDKVVQTKSQASRLETEIQALEMSMNRLKLEADEQYARELQSEG